MTIVPDTSGGAGDPAVGCRGVLRADRISVTLGGTNVLSDVSLDLAPGLTALLGPNGAGKTTLIRTLARVQRATTGRVLFQGRQVRTMRSGHFRRALGYLPQDPTWHHWMRGEDVLRQFAWMRKVPRADIESAVSRVLDDVALADRRRARCGDLSGGQFQRLMLATSLVHDPQVLLLDEPTVGLDPEQRLAFRGLMRRVAADRAVLLSTHLLDDVANAADELVVIDQGRVRFAGPQHRLLDRYGHASGSLSSELEAAYVALLRGER